MKIVSLSVGLPRDVMWHGRTVTTGIYKEPVTGRIALRKLNLDGDRQADLTVHGGEQGRQLPMGMFGENFTTEGFLEDTAHLGDRFAVGSAEVVVTQPRLPCYKLGLKFQSDEMVRRFLASGRTGFYLAVTREGEVSSGDEIKETSRDESHVPVPEITRLYVAKRYGPADVESVRLALTVKALPESWKEYFRERLAPAGV